VYVVVYCYYHLWWIKLIIKPRLQDARHTRRRHRATLSTHRIVPTQAWKVATDLPQHREYTQLPFSAQLISGFRFCRCWLPLRTSVDVKNKDKDSRQLFCSDDNKDWTQNDRDKGKDLALKDMDKDQNLIYNL